MTRPRVFLGAAPILSPSIIIEPVLCMVVSSLSFDAAGGTASLHQKKYDLITSEDIHERSLEGPASTSLPFRA